MTTTHRYPLTAASMASATPVLPEVGSTIVPPGLSRPLLSASAIIERPIRSFSDPPGLNHSSLAKIRAEPLEKRESSTVGVLPIDASRASSRRDAIGERTLNVRLLLRDDSKKNPGSAGASQRR